MSPMTIIMQMRDSSNDWCKGVPMSGSCVPKSPEPTIAAGVAPRQDTPEDYGGIGHDRHWNAQELFGQLKTLSLKDA